MALLIRHVENSLVGYSMSFNLNRLTYYNQPSTKHIKQFINGIGMRCFSKSSGN